MEGFNEIRSVPIEMVGVELMDKEERMLIIMLTMMFSGIVTKKTAA